MNDATRPIAARTPARAEAGLPEDAFVFCCFNNNYKILPPVFARLDAPAARRAAAACSGCSRTTPRRGATCGARRGRAGVATRRGWYSRRACRTAEHLARHRLADLFLDTLPCNAHTTASDALWAGLPLLTCAGKTFAGRVAASLLQAVGLPELVAASLEEYEALARSLAADPGRPRALREKLARQRLTAPAVRYRPLPAPRRGCLCHHVGEVPARGRPPGLRGAGGWGVTNLVRGADKPRLCPRVNWPGR